MISRLDFGVFVVMRWFVSEWCFVLFLCGVFCLGFGLVYEGLLLRECCGLM